VITFIVLLVNKDKVVLWSK